MPAVLSGTVAVTASVVFLFFSFEKVGGWLGAKGGPALLPHHAAADDREGGCVGGWGPRGALSWEAHQPQRRHNASPPLRRSLRNECSAHAEWFMAWFHGLPLQECSRSWPLAGCWRLGPSMGAENRRQGGGRGHFAMEAW